MASRTYPDSFASGTGNWAPERTHDSWIHQLLGLVCWIAVTFVAAGVGGIASMDAPDFYGSLLRPDWAPPAAVFGPVWTVLYALMGIAAWLVWRERGWARAKAPLLLFVAQLGFNALWTWVFFSWHEGALAFVEIVVLWLLIAATAVRFYRVRPLAAVLLLPYLGWVGFASALTLALWQMNPATLG